ncbi:MAG: hypothetical protein RSE47_04140 [Acidaminococcaceae bacterium]
MGERLVLRAKNEDTLLPRVLRVLAQQGLKVAGLCLEVVNQGQEIKLSIVLSNTGAAQAVKLLAKQVAVLTVVLHEEVLEQSA